VIVDQVGHHNAKAGLKTTEQIRNLFGSCTLVIGTCFTFSTMDIGIYGPNNKSESAYFIFGEPYNEDEVISYLKLYQSSEDQESHPDVDENILNELFASYHEFKENELKEDEKVKRRRQHYINGRYQNIPVDKHHPSYAWYIFREVTGFVPLYCWNVIKKMDHLVCWHGKHEHGSNDTLLYRLEYVERVMIEEVSTNSLMFYDQLEKISQSKLSYFENFLKISIENFNRFYKNNYKFIKAKRGPHVDSSDRNQINSFLRFMANIPSMRDSWDLSYVSCGYKNLDNFMFSPICLSRVIADGMNQVDFLFDADFCFLIIFNLKYRP